MARCSLLRKRGHGLDQIFDVELTVAGVPARNQENLPSAEGDPAWSADAASGRAWQADLMPESPPSAKATLTSLPYRLAVRRIILPWILQGVEPSGEGLEIGAGVGALTAQLLAQYPGFRMVATDTDAELVGMAEQVLSSFGRRASVQRADAIALPFPDGRFDLVLSAAMLHHVIEWDQALAEAVRVLRPGGKLVGYDVSDNAAGRLIRAGERRGASLLRPGQLETALSRLGLTDLHTRTALAGTVMRFSARKPAALTG
jgi:ubiquinone/menaquinone biosynthesis C-methylase UbiE